jgi:hypothetical protein
MVLCWHDSTLDSPVDAGYCKVAVEEFQMAAKANARFLKALKDL